MSPAGSCLASQLWWGAGPEFSSQDLVWAGSWE
jgi:hypothetical protein